MRGDDYYIAQRAAIHRLLGQDGTRIVVACPVDDEDAIAGWACHEGNTLHYVAVVRDLRGQGVARALLSGLSITAYTHKSKHLRSIPKGWAYQPFLFWMPAPARREKAA